MASAHTDTVSIYSVNSSCRVYEKLEDYEAHKRRIGTRVLSHDELDRKDQPFPVRSGDGMDTWAKTRQNPSSLVFPDLLYTPLL